MADSYTLSPDFARRIAEAVRWYERVGRRLPPGVVRSVDVASPGGDPTWLKIVGVESVLGSNRWQYDAELPDATPVLARNKMETANTVGKAGPGILPDELPAGFQLLPIGQLRDATTVECVVAAWYSVADSVWYFSAENAVDGECAAPVDDAAADWILDGGSSVIYGGEPILDGGTS